ncbi:MAG: hypothetical protein SGILL_004597 [Bacillariaceae sp.]
MKTGLCETRHEFLQCSILPMALSTIGVKRSTYYEQRKNYVYPSSLNDWSPGLSIPFEDMSLEESVANPLFTSACQHKYAIDEATEQAFLQYNVWDPLAAAGLRAGITELEENGATEVPFVYGLPDEKSYRFSSTDKKDASISCVVEVESTQDLVIPWEFAEMKERYEKAVAHEKENQSEDRSRYWSQIGRPFAQLFGYMLDNNVRFGALCSSHRTYFAFLNEAGEMNVTGAWFTGNRNFLKAWAAFLRLADEYNYGSTTSISFPDGWLQRTPIKTEQTSVACADYNGDNEGDHDGRKDDSRDEGDTGRARKRANRSSSNNAGKKKQRSTSNGASETTEAVDFVASFGQPQPTPALDGCDGREQPLQPLRRLETPVLGPRSCYELFDCDEGFVEFIDWSLLRVGARLGSGRNGDVFQALHKGEQIAIKQFDLNKNWASYEREVLAYKYLKKVWGKLVPTPKLISASPSGNVRYLGMTLGAPPTGDDDEHKEFCKKISILKTEHHFHHLDAFSGERGPEPFITVNDGDNGGKKVLVIDLEWWEIL